MASRKRDPGGEIQTDWYDWRLDETRQRVEIPTTKGLWVFEAPLGRRASSYLDLGKRHKVHKVYAGSIGFDELLLLVYFADLFDHARMTGEADYGYIAAVNATIARLRNWLEQGGPHA
jgi:hypothetical protein